MRETGPKTMSKLPYPARRQPVLAPHKRRACGRRQKTPRGRHGEAGVKVSGADVYGETAIATGLKPRGWSRVEELGAQVWGSLHLAGDFIPRRCSRGEVIGLHTNTCDNLSWLVAI